MKVIEKQWKYGTYLAYTDVEPELAEIQPRDRVLPAPFFYEKRLFFWLIKKYEPGEKKSFPNGGYEVRDENGGLRSYDLDQVILHPQVIKHKKTLDKMARRAEKEAAKRERLRKKANRTQPKEKGTGKRGRPPLDPAAKAERILKKAETAIKSGGKRGRPKSTEPREPKPIKVSSGKRGRPPLSEEARATKAADKAATSQRSGGRRGRPKKK